ncbi:hypothetical protein BGZ83_005008 [Gryganskiella cystojenkinii]|nr:hypothetical protein BGZ83_005008 [Gryganskiella cystojenkinii]
MSRQSNPFDHAESSSNNERQSIIIVNSDIMILPGGQQESQTDDEDDDEGDDDETLSSSGQSSRYGRANSSVPEPAPAPVVPAKDLYIAPHALEVPGSPTVSLYLGEAAPQYCETSPTTLHRTSQSRQPQPNSQYPVRPSQDPISPGRQQLHRRSSSTSRNENSSTVDLEMQDRGISWRPLSTNSASRGRQQAPSVDDTSNGGRAAPSVSSSASHVHGGSLPVGARVESMDLRGFEGRKKHGSTVTSGAITNKDQQRHPTSHKSTKNKSNSTSNSTGFLGGLFSSKKDKTGSSSSSQRYRSGGVVGLLGTTPESQSASGSKNDLIDLRTQQPQHPRHMRNDMVPEKHGLSSAQHKSGVPGKNGEEPETDPFNFVGIMLDLPEEPTWREIRIKLLKVLAVMTVSYFALMALYFGAEFQTNNRMNNFKVLVVDLDLSMIGTQYVTFTQQLNGQPGQPEWSVEPYTKYPNISVIKDEVSRGNYWGAVVVQPNASSTLNQALATLSPYDPSRAFAFIYDGGRDPLVVKPYIVATMYTTFLQFSKFFNPAWIKVALKIVAQSNVSATDLAATPEVLGTPVAFQEFDLHPPTASIITSATTVAYIWIFLVAGGSTYLVAHLIQPMTRNATVVKTVTYLLAPLLGFLVSLSMAYSLLLLAFGVPFDSASQFLSLFAGMLLLQCSVASMVIFLIYLIPVMFIPSFTITFVILNVIAVFNPVELMPAFYRWVYAMPFLNAVQIARFVLMGSFNRLRFNIPILLVWVLIPIVLLPFAISRQKRVARELAEEEDLRVDQQRQRQHQLKLQQQGDDDDEQEQDAKVPNEYGITEPQKTVSENDDDDQDTLSDAGANSYRSSQRHKQTPSSPNTRHHRTKSGDTRTRNVSPRHRPSTASSSHGNHGHGSNQSTSHHRRQHSSSFLDNHSSDEEIPDAQQTYIYQPPPPPRSRSQHKGQSRSQKHQQQQRPPPPSRTATGVEPSAPTESAIFGRSSGRGRPQQNSRHQLPTEVK